MTSNEEYLDTIDSLHRVTDPNQTIHGKHTRLALETDPTTVCLIKVLFISSHSKLSKKEKKKKL